MIKTGTTPNEDNTMKIEEITISLTLDSNKIETTSDDAIEELIDELEELDLEAIIRNYLDNRVAGINVSDIAIEVTN